MQDPKIIQIFWKSLSEAGLLAGICLLGFRAMSFDEPLSFILYLLTLVVLTLTIFNVRIYTKRKEKKPGIEYVIGHDKTMQWLIPQVNDAMRSIWVTRFSKGALSKDSEYFKATNKKIKGEKCRPIYSYRRIIKLDTLDKIDFAMSLIEEHAKHENFLLKKTNIFMPFEVVLIDEKSAFILFHDRDGTRTIDAGIKLTNWEIVSKFIEIYNHLWNHNDTHLLKEGSLSDKEKEEILEKLNLLRNDSDF